MNNKTFFLILTLFAIFAFESCEKNSSGNKSASKVVGFWWHDKGTYTYDNLLEVKDNSVYTVYHFDGSLDELKKQLKQGQLNSAHYEKSDTYSVSDGIVTLNGGIKNSWDKLWILDGNSLLEKGGSEGFIKVQ